ncbi:MAG TPA: endonuclease/exonuclease/phosphatase family protein [Rhodanobacteraceae bacterium]|nr:endonuclease/exonuclease/phosphatase family protein [Rhodanobacteraceae bacterium]
MTRLCVATYNVHSGVGVDRRFRPQRIADVIGELGADVVALQEVLSPVRGFDVHAHLGATTGFHLAAMATMQLAGGTFGNALLCRWPILDLAEHGLTVGSREPRGAIDATLGRGRQEIRVIATHLGLRSAERHEQLSRLVELVERRRELPTVLLGDFNATRAKSREIRAHAERLGTASVLATFPSIAPVLPLDRIFALHGAEIVDVAVHRSRLARVASDHLPLVATIEWPD